MFIFFLALNVILLIWQIAVSDDSPEARQLQQDNNVRQLVLLSEAQDNGAKTKSKTKTVEKAKAEKKSKPKTGALVCYALGPFKDNKQSSSVAGKLRDIGAQTDEREEVNSVPLGFWVYLPPYDDWKAARADVLALEKKGLKDIFIMGRGAMKNAVSLGLFKNEKGAKERIAQVKKMGKTPKMEPQERDETSYWIDIDIERSNEKAIESIENIAKGLTLLKLEKRKCG